MGFLSLGPRFFLDLDLGFGPRSPYLNEFWFFLKEEKKSFLFEPLNLKFKFHITFWIIWYKKPQFFIKKIKNLQVKAFKLFFKPRFDPIQFLLRIQLFLTNFKRIVAVSIYLYLACHFSTPTTDHLMTTANFYIQCFNLIISIIWPRSFEFFYGDLIKQSSELLNSRYTFEQNFFVEFNWRPL